MKISTKLFVGFAVIILISFIVSAIGIAGMRRLHDSGVYMYQNRILALQYVNNASAMFSRLRLSSRQAIIRSFYDDRKGAENAQRGFEEDAAQFRLWLQKSREIAMAEELTNDELIKFHDKISELFEQSYYPRTALIIEQSIDNIPDHANKLRLNVDIAAAVSDTAAIESLFEGLVDLNAALAERANAENDALTRQYITLQVILIASSIIIAGAVAYFIIKGIARPINESTQVLGLIATGDFTARVTGDYRGDMEHIKNSVNDTAARLALHVEREKQAQRDAYNSEIEKARVEAASEVMLASIVYAAKIQQSMLPGDYMFSSMFSDYSIIWKPRDIVGGDIYWIRHFNNGTVFCVCDCTGHGTSGALLTTLVTASLESVVRSENCSDTADIIWRLEQRLVHVLSADGQRATGLDIKDGCDIAVLFVARDDSVTISTGHTHVFICNGDEVRQIRGQNIYVGEGRLRDKDDVMTTRIRADSRNKFYIATDGLFEQVGGERSEPYGYKEFKQIILESHEENLPDVSAKIWAAFEKYRGNEQRVDDIQLICFKP